MGPEGTGQDNTNILLNHRAVDKLKIAGTLVCHKNIMRKQAAQSQAASVQGVLAVAHMCSLEGTLIRCPSSDSVENLKHWWKTCSIYSP